MFRGKIRRQVQCIALAGEPGWSLKHHIPSDASHWLRFFAGVFACYSFFGRHCDVRTLRLLRHVLRI